jgi:hypothetical protein
MRNVNVKRKHHNVHALFEVGSQGAQVVSLMRSRQVPPAVAPVTTPAVDVAMTTVAAIADPAAPSLTSAPSDPSNPDAGLLYSVGIGLLFVVVGFGVAMYFGRGDAGSRSGRRSGTGTHGGMAAGSGTPSSVARMADTHVDVDMGSADVARDERIAAHRRGTAGGTDSDDDLPVKPPPVRHGVKTDNAAQANKVTDRKLKSDSASSHQLDGRDRASSSYKVRGEQSPGRG